MIVLSTARITNKRCITTCIALSVINFQLQGPTLPTFTRELIIECTIWVGKINLFTKASNAQWQQVIFSKLTGGQLTVADIVLLFKLQVTFMKVCCCAQHFCFFIFKRRNKISWEILKFNRKCFQNPLHFNVGH